MYQFICRMNIKWLWTFPHYRHWMNIIDKRVLKNKWKIFIYGWCNIRIDPEFNFMFFKQKWIRDISLSNQWFSFLAAQSTILIFFDNFEWFFFKKHLDFYIKINKITVIPSPLWTSLPNFKIYSAPYYSNLKKYYLDWI